MFKGIDAYSNIQILISIIVNIVMEDLVKLSKLVMRMNLRILSLKIW